MTDQGELYGEVPASAVEPGALRAAENVLAFCLARYAGPGHRAPTIRWLRAGRVNNACARLLDVAKWLGGAEVDALEKGHDSGGGFAGFVRRAGAGTSRERWGQSIFLLDELPAPAAAFVAAHEFYHRFYKSTDESAANDFARRVLRLMELDND